MLQSRRARPRRVNCRKNRSRGSVQSCTGTRVASSALRPTVTCTWQDMVTWDRPWVSRTTVRSYWLRMISTTEGLTARVQSAWADRTGTPESGENEGRGPQCGEDRHARVDAPVGGGLR